ncbi:mischarged aminoacyl-tRNA deacylase [Nocardiopsis rhodophaea]|uniref:Mischarged aminoacyl-tRNA deacylase n=1 Tax=Nocardiopsis rhodophaea TaxID=280238 RepID=A0ABN2T751_9ACTN
MPPEDTHEKLITLLDERGADYRVIEHPPEGATKAVSRLRGHDPRHAAKCIIVMIKTAEKERRYAAAVLPGDKRVDFDRMKSLFQGVYAGFAPREVAECLAGTPVGTIPPFSFHEELELIADPEVFEFPEVFFNAPRLDRTIALPSTDYRAIAEPRIEPIARD